MDVSGRTDSGKMEALWGRGPLVLEKHLDGVTTQGCQDTRCVRRDPGALSCRGHQLDMAGSSPKMPQDGPGTGQQSHQLPQTLCPPQTILEAGRARGGGWEHRPGAVHSPVLVTMTAPQSGSMPRTGTRSPGPTQHPAHLTPPACSTASMGRLARRDKHAYTQLKYVSPKCLKNTPTKSLFFTPPRGRDELSCPTRGPDLRAHF